MKFKIGNKLALVMIGLSIVVIVLLSSLYYFQFERALEERVLFQLSSVKRLKVSQIREELNSFLKLIESFKAESDSSLFTSGQFSSVNVVDSMWLSSSGYDGQQPTGQEVLVKDITVADPAGEITLAYITRHQSDFLVAVAKPDIQSILLERTGLGETGESYLVGSDYRMRSTSRFFPERNPTKIMAETHGVHEALNGQPGSGLISDYRDVDVFSSYELIRFHGLTWVILSEIDREEAFIPLGHLKYNFLIILLIIFIFVLIASYWLSRQIVKPIVVMEHKLTQMAKGNIDQSIDEKKRQDEIGKMFAGLSKLIMALNQAVNFAREIGNGNFEADYDLLSEDDKLGTALLQMKHELRQLKENEARLVIAGQKALLNGEETERSRLSRELHDGLGPLLTIIRIKVQVAEIPDPMRHELLAAIDDTIREVRRMSNNLMPSVLEDFGAGEAIGNLVKQMNSEHLKVLYRYENTDNVQLSKSVNITLYRIAQECLNNAIRHSGASEVRISLTEFEDKVSLFVVDNGRGFDLDRIRAGNGLFNVKERVKVEDGLLDIQSDDSGTKIEVEIPVK